MFYSRRNFAWLLSITESIEVIVTVCFISQKQMNKLDPEIVFYSFLITYKKKCCIKIPFTDLKFSSPLFIFHNPLCFNYK